MSTTTRTVITFGWRLSLSCGQCRCRIWELPGEGFRGSVRVNGGKRDLNSRMVTEQKPQLSVIAPVHNGGQEVAVRLGRLADDLRRIVAGPFEVVVVDDGSDAETGRVIEALAEQRADFHAVHHPRQLGFELAGQTGLERARADLVFICEDDRPVRTADLQQLWRMAEDPSVVAARAESHPLPASRSFVQRFQQLAGHHRLRDAATGASSPATIQLLRRPSLEALRRDGDLEIEHQCFRSETAVG